MRTLITVSLGIIGLFVGAVLGVLTNAPSGTGSMTGLIVGLVGGYALARQTYGPRQRQYWPGGPGPRRPRQSA